MDTVTPDTGMTISRSYSRQAVNSLCETMRYHFLLLGGSALSCTSLQVTNTENNDIDIYTKDPAALCNDMAMYKTEDGEGVLYMSSFNAWIMGGGCNVQHHIMQIGMETAADLVDVVEHIFNEFQITCAPPGRNKGFPFNDFY